jgi:hypothetical protein
LVVIPKQILRRVFREQPTRAHQSNLENGTIIYSLISNRKWPFQSFSLQFHRFLKVFFVWSYYRVGLSSFFDVVSGDYHCSSMVDTLADKMIPDAAIIN